MEENLKEAVVKPVLLSSSSTSLPIRSLNVVGDCVLLCGGLRTLCLACAKTHTLSWERRKNIGKSPRHHVLDLIKSNGQILVKNILPALVKEALGGDF